MINLFLEHLFVPDFRANRKWRERKKSFSFDAILCNTRCLMCVYIPISWIYFESVAPSGRVHFGIDTFETMSFETKQSNCWNKFFEKEMLKLLTWKIILFIFFQFKFFSVLTFSASYLAFKFKQILSLKCNTMKFVFWFRFEILEVECCAFETFWMIMKRYVLIFVRVPPAAKTRQTIKKRWK